jgi:hypothetical protein
MWNLAKVTLHYVPVMIFCSKGMCEAGQYACIREQMVAWIDATVREYVCGGIPVRRLETEYSKTRRNILV